jgi:uncharacterized protein (DUF433 family)
MTIGTIGAAARLSLALDWGLARQFGGGYWRAKGGYCLANACRPVSCSALLEYVERHQARGLTPYDGRGGLRVGPTRVSLESVWHLYQQGASPAEIVRAFDTLQPADVHAVLAWALRHPEELDAYLKRRDEEAAQIRHQLEEAGLTPTRQESAKLKDVLEARRQELRRRGAGDAALSDG